MLSFIHAPLPVIPAKAGIQCFRFQKRRCATRPLGWVSASAGMTTS